MICGKPFVKEIGERREYFPCGRCFNCRINQARIIKNRIILERKVSKDSLFGTLTYNDEHLPTTINPDTGEILNNLQKDDLLNYIKRIRRAHEPVKLRYYAVGEYGMDGERNWNPHYHICLFSSGNIDRNTLKEKWVDDQEKEIGFTSFGDIGDGAAGYIAGYLQKKATKPYYSKMDIRCPEFSSQSRQKGGIGYAAILEIAEKIKKNPQNEGRILETLLIGRKALPLGRYLVHKLADELKIDKKEFTKKYYKYVMENEKKYGNPDDKSDMRHGRFMNKMLDETKGKRDSQKKRLELKSRRKKL